MLLSITATEEARTQQNNLLLIQIQNQQPFRSQHRPWSQHQRNNSKLPINPGEPPFQATNPLSAIPSYANQPPSLWLAKSAVSHNPPQRRKKVCPWLENTHKTEDPVVWGQMEARPRGMRYYGTETLLKENRDIARREIKCRDLARRDKKGTETDLLRRPLG